MSEHGITASNILRSLPIALQGDPSVVALSQATAEELAKMPAKIDLARIYAAIDRLPEAVLDILAYDFKIDWWDGNYSIDQKRRVFRNSFLVHRRLGTRWAVDTAIASVYPGSVTEEWFEYGGDAYHYRIFIETCREPLDVVQVLKAAQRVKRLAAHCDGILFQCTVGIVIATNAHGYKYHVLPTGIPIAGTWPQRNTIGAPRDMDIDVVTGAHGFKYNSPEAGTVPQRNTEAGIYHGDIEVLPTAQGYSYDAPMTDTELSGEWPQRNTSGAMGDTDALVTADANGYTYNVIQSGEYPQRNIEFQTGQGGVEIEQTGKSYSYSTPATGQETAGTYPQRDTAGGYADSDASVTATGAGYKYTIQNAEYSGQEPTVQTESSYVDGGFCTTVDTDFWSYAVRYCGNVYCNQTKDGILNRCY